MWSRKTGLPDSLQFTKHFWSQKHFCSVASGTSLSLWQVPFKQQILICSNGRQFSDYTGVRMTPKTVPCNTLFLRIVRWQRWKSRYNRHEQRNSQLVPLREGRTDISGRAIACNPNSRISHQCWASNRINLLWNNCKSEFKNIFLFV